MDERIERTAVGLYRFDTESFEFRQKLLPDQLDALEQDLGGSSPSGGVDRALEVVDDVEQAGEDVAAAPLRVAGDFLPHPRARLVEFMGRLAILRQRVLKLPILLGELAFQLLDVRRLQRRL